MSGSIQTKHGKGILISGSPVVYFYGTNLIVSTISKGHTPYVIDSETSFDPYAVCRIARRVGLSPKYTLKKIKVARSFNPYQTLEIIRNLPKSKDIVVFLYGPLTLMEDPDFSTSEQRMLYKELLRLTSRTIHRGQWVIFLQDEFNKNIIRMLKGVHGTMGLVIKVEGNAQLKVLKNNLSIKALGSMEVREWAERFCRTPLFWRRNYAN